MSRSEAHGAARTLYSRALDEELNHRDARRLWNHLGACAACRRWSTRLRRALESLTRLAPPGSG